jgi:hypothetical protein
MVHLRSFAGGQGVLDAATTAATDLWSTFDDERQPVREAEMARIRAHPRFAEACISVTRYIVSINTSDPELVKMQSDIQRIVLGLLVIYLDACGGVTYAAIKQCCVDNGLSSPGRATAILLQMRLIGYIEPAPIQPDRRSRLYRASAKTRAANIRLFGNSARAAAALDPILVKAAERFDEPNVFDRFVVQMGDTLQAVIRRGAKNAVSLFDRRSAGLGILYRLALNGQPGDVYPPRLPFPVSINALAAEFHVSRPHVRKLLNDADAAGLVRRDTDASTLAFSELLRNDFADYLAFQLITYIVAARAALGDQ